MAGWRSRAAAEARSRARDHARWLLRDHGDQAEEVLEEKLQRKDSSSSMHAVYRLARRELRALRRERRRLAGPLPFWEELLLKLRSLFRGRRRGRRRRR